MGAACGTNASSGGKLDGDPSQSVPLKSDADDRESLRGVEPASSDPNMENNDRGEENGSAGVGEECPPCTEGQPDRERCNMATGRTSSMKALCRNYAGMCPKHPVSASGIKSDLFGVGSGPGAAAAAAARRSSKSSKKPSVEETIDEETPTGP